MIEKYIAINRTLRSIHATAVDIIDAYNFESGGFATSALTSVMRRLLSDLKRLWPADLDTTKIEEIEQVIVSDSDASSYWSVINDSMPPLEDLIDDYFSSQPYSDLNYMILDILHPRVTASSYAHFKGGRFREAILNSVVAVFDFIRERTGIDRDGAGLITESFSLEKPHLVFSNIDSESGRNDQKGFIQILQGLYQGVRNPKAHTLAIKPSQNEAAQYLVFSSLLCRRVEEAKIVENDD